jgi:uncharacterized protein
MPDAPTHLLYLHGFRSSPLSFKAQRLARWLREHRPQVQLWCPQLPPSPREAMDLVARGVTDWPAATSAVLGSSLGGFYATVVAESPGHERWPCVVMNPAVDPARDLAAYIGEQSAFHHPEERFFFRAEFVAELRAMSPGPISRAERYFALIAKGDELLDWREMFSRYPGAKRCLLDGSDHALSDFEAHLPLLLRHLGLSS